MISVIVVTYNSTRFILETLESIKKQHYQNIELIVSDDCSMDNTVELVEQWLKENKDRFINSIMITVPENTGIVANCNRGLRAAGGKYVKVIAGDDLLLETCLSDNIAFAEQYHVQFLFSQMMPFTDEVGAGKIKKNIQRHRYLEEQFRLSVNEQYEKLLRFNFCPAPTSFMDRSILLDLGGYDERFTMLEDHPLWIKATQNGYRLYMMDQPTVMYRVRNDSVTSRKESNVNKALLKDVYELYTMIRRPHLSAIEKWDEDINSYFAKKKLEDRFKPYHKLLRRIARLTSPANYVREIKRLFRP